MARSAWVLLLVAAAASVCAASANAIEPAEQPRKFWVFFRDRESGRAKSQLAEPARWLTSRALERRVRRGRGSDAEFSEADLPVEAEHRERVAATGARIVVSSRWLNAVSVAATPVERARIADLSCVARIAPVALRAAREPSANLGTTEDSRAGGRAARPLATGEGDTLDYGASLAQLAQIGVPALHGSGYSGSGIVIGLLDSGFESTHPSFASTSILAERDFVNADSNTADEGTEFVSLHGTAVFSAVGGFAPGELIGAAYGASFLLAKTEDVRNEYQAEEDFWVAGIEWQESLGVDVVSSSLGYRDWYVYAQMDGATAVTTRAAQMAVDRGVVVVNSMGNERGNAWNYLVAPSDAEGVISVGAVDMAGTAGSFSSVGPTADGRLKPDVVALGVGVQVARGDFNRGGPTYWPGAIGTSFATPLVAGAAALILQADPDATPSEIQSALRCTASRAAAPDTSLGYGLVRAADALAFSPPDSGGCKFAGTPPPIALRIASPFGGVFAPARGGLGWHFDLPRTSRVTARLFDVAGRIVATLFDANFDAGVGLDLPWDGRTASGDDAPSGVYLLRLETPAGAAAARVILVR